MILNLWLFGAAPPDLRYIIISVYHSNGENVGANIYRVPIFQNIQKTLLSVFRPFFGENEIWNFSSQKVVFLKLKSFMVAAVNNW